MQYFINVYNQISNSKARQINRNVFLQDPQHARVHGGHTRCSEQVSRQLTKFNFKVDLRKLSN